MQSRIPDDIQHDYGGHCWWCGAVADSREHRYKRSDLTREFGPGAWRDQDAVVRVVAGTEIRIQGANSKNVKFEKNLCASCNNTRSQPFDVAYDEFMTYIREHEDRIISDQSFELSHIFGPNWTKRRKLFERYIVKYICCRLAEDRVEIPTAVINYLNDWSQPYPPHLTIWLEIRLDIVDLMKQSNEDGFSGGSLWKGDMFVNFSKSARTIVEAQSFYGYRWLRINYKLDTRTRKGTTNFRGDKVQLPADRNVSPHAMREHFRQTREEKGDPRHGNEIGRSN